MARTARRHRGGARLRRQSSGCARSSSSPASRCTRRPSTPTSCCRPSAGWASARRSPPRWRRGSSPSSRATRAGCTTRSAAGRERPAPRLAIVRAVASGALDRAVDVAATLEVRGYGAARRPQRARRPWSRHDVAFAASAVALVAIAVLAPVSFSASPDVQRARRRGRRRYVRRAGRLHPAAVRRPPGDRAMSGPDLFGLGGSPGATRALLAERLTYTYPGAGGARAARRRPGDRARASSSCSPARAARASRRCCARRAGWCRTSTAASSPAGWRSAGSTRASTGRRRWPPSRGRCSRIPRRRS